MLHWEKKATSSSRTKLHKRGSSTSYVLHLQQVTERALVSAEKLVKLLASSTKRVHSLEALSEQLSADLIIQFKF
jgi:hypothetical protein